MSIVITSSNYEAALARMKALWAAEPGSPDAVELDHLAEQVERYEEAGRANVLPRAQPGPLIAYKLVELGWSQRALARRLGWPSGRVCEVISGKRSLTLAMVRDLSSVLDIEVSRLIHADSDRPPQRATVQVDAELLHEAKSRNNLGFASVEALLDGLLQRALWSPAGSVASFRQTTQRKRVVAGSFHCTREAA